MSKFVHHPARLRITHFIRHLVILFLVLLPGLGSAQVGRIFVSAEAYAGTARIVYVGKGNEPADTESGK